MANRIQEETSDSNARIERAFQRCFQRQPLPRERELAGRLVSGHGLFALCRMLLNSNEFIYLD
jgi:hypothetical protein